MTLADLSSSFSLSLCLCRLLGESVDEGSLNGSWYTRGRETKREEEGGQIEKF